MAAKKHEINMITDCEMSEEEINSLERPSIVIYFVEDGDSLWSVAKRYGTTVEKIKTANNMEDDIFVLSPKLHDVTLPITRYSNNLFNKYILVNSFKLYDALSIDIKNLTNFLNEIKGGNNV